MVSNAVNPCAEGASPIEMLETPPQLEVNVLAQVAAFFLIRFVSACEPFERGAELICRFAIKRILIRMSR